MTGNTKMPSMFSGRRLIAGIGLLLLIMLSVIGPLMAQSITQGYGSDVQLQRGMLVMLKQNDGTKVELASTGDIEKVHGVVVNANDSPVTLSTENQKVFVATQGRFEVLVSNENGKIKTGDYLTVSSLQGIGMKADRRQPVTVARALSDFDGGSDAIGSQPINNNVVSIGRIDADISVIHNPLSTPEKNSVPEILQATSEFIARKPVSPPRLYASLGIFIISMIISGGMFYTGIRSSITAIGRNPLSKRDISKSMAQVILTSLIVFIIGVFAVYLLLKL